MKQQTLAVVANHGAGSENRRKKDTHRDEFLDAMNTIVPWAGLCAVVEPFYLRHGNRLPPIGLERLLRIHFIQHWFNLADFDCEEALYDSTSLRRFADVDLNCGAVPDAMTLLEFRCLLESNKLGGTTLRQGAVGSAGQWDEAQQRKRGCDLDLLISALS